MATFGVFMTNKKLKKHVGFGNLCSFHVFKFKNMKFTDKIWYDKVGKVWYHIVFVEEQKQLEVSVVDRLPWVQRKEAGAGW